MTKGNRYIVAACKSVLPLGKTREIGLKIGHAHWENLNSEIHILVFRIRIIIIICTAITPNDLPQRVDDSPSIARTPIMLRP